MPDTSTISLSLTAELPEQLREDLAKAHIAATPGALTVQAATYDEAVERVRTALAAHAAFVARLQTAPEPSAGDKSSVRLRRVATLAIRVLIALGCLAAAVLGHLWKWDVRLVVALLATGSFELVATAGYWLWARSSFAQADSNAAAMTVTAAPANAYADAAKVALSTQGVVLGLISFKESTLDTTLKVGAASLGAGVLLSAFLYFNVVLGDPTTSKQRFAAAVLFSLMLWTLGFGLVCVVAGNWS